MQKVQQKAKNKNQKGVALILTLVVFAIAFAIVLALAAVFLIELQSSGLTAASTKSFYAADAAIEQALYKHRKGSAPANESGSVSSSQSWQYQAQCPIACRVGDQVLECNEITATGISGSTQRVLTVRYVVSSCP